MIRLRVSPMLARWLNSSTVLDEPYPTVIAALEPEREHRARTRAKVLPRPRVKLVPGSPA